jgi:hypothetical protein
MIIRGYALTILCLILVMATAEAVGIPAFARKYDMSCLTCHEPFPRLKPYGNEFAGNGFQLPDKESPRFFRQTGDDELMLMRELPLALRLEGFARWQPQTSGRTDFQWPYLMKLLSGGVVAKDVAYYFYFFFGERGEVAGLEDAFIMFNNLFSQDIDLYLGQFQVSDPLFKRELRLTLEDYQIYRSRPGASRVDLTYDRGIMATAGFPSETDIVLEVLNGSGIGSADVARNFDTDKYKNLMGRISQEAGEHLRVGGFFYWGKEEQAGAVNSLWMAGPDITLSLEPFEMNLQYVERRDDDPTFAGGKNTVSNRGGFAEVLFAPEGDRSTWYGVLLYNWVEGGAVLERYHTVTGHASYMLARNLRLVGEYSYDIRHRAHRLTAGFVSAF